MDTQYHPLAMPEKRAPRVSVNSLSRSSRSSPIFSKKSRPKSLIWHIFSHIVSFLWLAPIITLLVLNFKNHIIGASAWCPGGHCSSGVGSSDPAAVSNTIERAAKLDRNDHNVLGALQFVAKALEVWFMLIATALLFDLAMILARMDGGLPVAYVLTHLEFGDIRNLFNPLLWTSPWPHRNATHSQKHRRSVSRLFIFAVLAALLTILTNLMGPATAVLVLPTLQWVDTPHKPVQMFKGLHLDRAPQEDLIFPICNSSQLDAGNYSCTFYPHSASLDQFASAALSTEVQWEQPYGAFAMTALQESAVNFALNATTDGSLVWVPNRQVLRFLTVDFNHSIYPQTYGTGTSLNESLQLILNRQGPSIGFQAYCNNGNVSVTKVADDKEIHCFSNYTQDFLSHYTKVSCCCASVARCTLTLTSHGSAFALVKGSVRSIERPTSGWGTTTQTSKSTARLSTSTSPTARPTSTPPKTLARASNAASQIPRPPPATGTPSSPMRAFPGISKT